MGDKPAAQRRRGPGSRSRTRRGGRGPRDVGYAAGRRGSHAAGGQFTDHEVQHVDDRHHNAANSATDDVIIDDCAPTPGTHNDSSATYAGDHRSAASSKHAASDLPADVSYDHPDDFPAHHGDDLAGELGGAQRFQHPRRQLAPADQQIR